MYRHDFAIAFLNRYPTLPGYMTDCRAMPADVGVVTYPGLGAKVGADDWSRKHRTSLPGFSPVGTPAIRGPQTSVCAYKSLRPVPTV